ncbi:HlyD family secretion protein [Burkholderia thailandensis]|uniref:HlyD secretion family protein n=2 Tax=Burkholderia thailandensis TaxID=57975 RepID=A0AAW9CL17_BURTH|nr:HlyD family efflux transporter periplasmic adaptor subunit [Burkholderia thailandensis]ABC35651.1 secretion protein, putative [Burkholderia thailandensis E264]AHI67864.1 hlyD secretion family protein [Burkholderia thailandensis H0587]AHI75596.1 hlyD secretion family protein [Burkholderia thailandensis 2002721723]AHI80666.1 hlyD secretion family protein [Burkholderia thailandensis E444]AIC90146.1 hlyD secretion family protein [Burkholderia thailandensis USAMRU Malaysia \
MPIWMTALREQKTPRKLTRGTAFGTVINGVVDVPISMRFFCYLSIAMFAMFIVALVRLTYANTENVMGMLTPRSGLIGVGAPPGWAVREVFVAKDQHVKAGQKLLSVTRDTSFVSQANNVQGMRESIKRQRVEVGQQIDAAKLEYQSTIQQINQQIAAFDESRGLIDKQIQDQKRIVSEYQERRDRVKQLLNEQVVTLEQYNQVNTQYLQASQAYQDLMLRRADLAKNAMKLRGDLETVQSKYDGSNAELKIKQEELNSKEYNIDESVNQVLYAPADGQIVRLDVVQGSVIDPPGTRVVEILPAKADGLIAELYIPSSKAGFVRPGQEVKLAYGSYPVEKFGTYRGKLLSVSPVAFTAKELNLPADNGAPQTYFKSWVELVDRNPAFEGKALALKAGMTLRADIVLEKRTLLEWLFEPLYRIRQRIFGTPA